MLIGIVDCTQYLKLVTEMFLWLSWLGPMSLFFFTNFGLFIFQCIKFSNTSKCFDNLESKKVTKIGINYIIMFVVGKV